MDYSTYLPSKKLIYLIAGIGAVGLLLFVRPMVKSDSKNKKLTQKLTQELTQEVRQEAEKDGDQDGLKDWEETLWKTDPRNPDTDKDGTKDGEEIKQNRDPLKPGPDDKLPDLETKSPSGITDLNPEDYRVTNLTGQMAKTLGFQVLNGAKNNFIVPSESELLDSVSEKTLTGFTALFHPQISENDLIVINDNSEENLAKYLQSFNKIVVENPLPEKSQEEVFLQAIRDKNFSGAEEYINYYQKIIQELKAIPAPKTVLSHHKRFVELLLAKIAVLENLKEIKRDPLKVIIALQEHEKINEEIQQLFSEFGNLFQ